MSNRGVELVLDGATPDGSLPPEFLRSSVAGPVVGFTETPGGDDAVAPVASGSASNGPKTHAEILADFRRDYAVQLKFVNPEKSDGVSVTQQDPEAVRDAAVLDALTALATAENRGVQLNWADANKEQSLLRVIQKVFAFNFLTQLEEALPEAAYAVLGRSAPVESPLYIENTQENFIFSRIAALLVLTPGARTALGMTMGPVGNFTIRRGEDVVDLLVSDAQRAAPQMKELLHGDVLVYSNAGVTKEFDMSSFSESAESTVSEDTLETLTACVDNAKDETVAALRFLTAYLRRHEKAVLLSGKTLVQVVEAELGAVAAATTAAVSAMRAEQPAPRRDRLESRTGTVLASGSRYGMHTPAPGVVGEKAEALRRRAGTPPAQP